MEIDKTKFDWTDDDLVKFYSQIEYFKSFRHKPINQETFFEAYKTCYLLFDKIPLATTRVDVNFILRGRPNQTQNHFKEECEISYNSRNKDSIGLGRFNRPLEPMFYGCVLDELGDNHFGIVSAMECHKELFIDGNTTTTQYFTFGKWYLNTHFDVINLCNDEKCLSANPNLSNTTKTHEKYIGESFPPKVADFIIEFWRFLSELAANKFENDQDHLLTTTFLSAIINYQKNEMNLDIHGALYPSTMTENRGLNVVLTPETVDKYLTLKSVFMVKFTRDAKNLKTFTVEQCTEEAMVNNHEFSFVKLENY